MLERELLAQAHEAKKYSYAPYSKFRVGAALLGKSGKVYLGCNIENASYGATNCAERTAFFKGISEGEKEFLAISIVGEEGTCAPCGMCRQVMREFCDPKTFQIILEGEGKDIFLMKLEELLPLSFGPDNLRTKEKKIQTVKNKDL